MIRTALKIVAFVGVGVVASVIPWGNAADYYNTPGFDEFQTLIVTDFDTAYTAEEFVEMGGVITSDGSIAPGSAVCPSTGTTKFKKVVARTVTNFWGTTTGYELAAAYQEQLRVKNAKGDMEWAQLAQLAQQLAEQEKRESEGAAVDTPANSN